MKIKEITDFLESLAPLSSQESYDNSGLIIGDPNTEIDKVLVSLDCIEATVDEAIESRCKLIIAHHPIVFKGLKKLNGSNYIERTVIKAIQNNIAIYAIHTNFDHYKFGVNYEIAERLGLKNIQILSPKKDALNKLVCYVPMDHVESVANSMFDAGAGSIGDYTECSFQSMGKGTFKPGERADPFEGKSGELSEVEECKLEVLVSNHLIGNVLKAMNLSHPYEEVAYEVYPILNQNQFEGAGMVGELEMEMESVAFLTHLKKVFNCGVIRHTSLGAAKISKIAFCGGSGSFLLTEAKKSGANIFITADFKYHEFFDAENEIIIADIGHFESEQFTSNRIARILTKKFPKFAVRLTEVNTNPINYF